MSVPILAPDLGTDRGTVSLWFVKPGERLHEGDRIVELQIPGATIDLTAPVTGTMGERLALQSDRVTHGQVLGVIHADPDQ